jgi:RecA-family ATPase
MAVCSGDKDFLGFEIQAQHRSAIYVSTEDDETAISYLLNKQNKGKGYASTAYKGLRYLFDLGNDLVKELDKRLKRKPADLIIIDAFTDLYGKNMNESNQVRFFLNDYSQLAQKHQCLIVFLHHTGKRTEEQAPSKHNLLGSQAFEAKMRLVIELRVDYHNPELRHLCIVKGNYLPAELKQESYVLRFDEHMLFHSTGERASFEELIKPQEDGNSNTDEKQRAIQMRENGASVGKIAQSLGRSKSTIQAWTKSVRSSEHSIDSERTNDPFD